MSAILSQKGDLAAFRSAMREWLGRVVPSDWRENVAGDDDALVDLQRWWLAERAKVGLATAHWPIEYGGEGLEQAHQIIIAEEFARADAPPLRLFNVSMTHLPSTLIAWGSDYQKKRYLPGVAQGTVWCQGFSEPNAGSDLAALRTRAVRDGEDYVINGQKIWSSHSPHADYCILLARTDPDAPRKQAGISFFLLDMRSPGVEVRPIRQATGSSEFAEVFLTDVRINAIERVGEENQGWTVAQTTLTSERGLYAFEIAERQRHWIERFHCRALQDDADWLKDDALRREFMGLFAEAQAGRRLLRKLLRQHDAPSTDRRSAMRSLFIKLTASQLGQRIADFTVRASGLDGQRGDKSRISPGAPMFDFMNSFTFTIGGGTNDIIRNLIAERGLELPK